MSFDRDAYQKEIKDAIDLLVARGYRVLGSGELKVLYLCDRRACADGCRHGKTGCIHTIDITHAKNFKKLNDIRYVEEE